MLQSTFADLQHLSQSSWKKLSIMRFDTSWHQVVVLMCLTHIWFVSWSHYPPHLSILSCLSPTILINKSGRKAKMKLKWNWMKIGKSNSPPFFSRGQVPFWTDTRYTDRGQSLWSCKCHHMPIIVFQAASSTWNYSDIWLRLRSPCCLLPGLSACYARCNQLLWHKWLSRPSAPSMLNTKFKLFTQ